MHQLQNTSGGLKPVLGSVSDTTIEKGLLVRCESTDNANPKLPETTKLPMVSPTTTENYASLIASNQETIEVRLYPPSASSSSSSSSSSSDESEEDYEFTCMSSRQGGIARDDEGRPLCGLTISSFTLSGINREAQVHMAQYGCDDDFFECGNGRCLENVSVSKFEEHPLHHMGGG